MDETRKGLSAMRATQVETMIPPARAGGASRVALMRAAEKIDWFDAAEVGVFEASDLPASSHEVVG